MKQPHPTATYGRLTRLTGTPPVGCLRHARRPNTSVGSGWRQGLILASLFWLSLTAGLAEDYLSPTALVSDREGAHLYVAEFTGRRISVVDVAKGKVSAAHLLPAAPNGLALTPDGKRLVVACGEADGLLLMLDAVSGSIVTRARVGHTPVAPVVTSDGRRAFVCNRFNHSVALLDLENGRELGHIDVRREPIAAGLTPDGKLLFVANHLPAGASTQPPVAAIVSVIDPQTKKVVSEVSLPDGGTHVRGLAVDPTGAYVFVTHLLSRYHLPTTQLERGWMNTAALTVIDVASRTRLNTVLLDDVDLGAANPWGVACSADGKWVVVSHAGTHELSLIDAEGLVSKLRRAAAGEKVSEVSPQAEDIPNDLSFMLGLRRRVQLEGQGARAVVIVGNNAYVADYFSDRVESVNLLLEGRLERGTVALGPAPTPNVVRRGEMLFHDAALCFQHWQSCASCHPDARVDSLNWDLLNDGVGNPKNTRNMLLAHRTPPAMSLGVRETAEMAVRAGIRRIQFVERPEEDAVAIDEYLKALKPVPSPHLVQGKLSRSAQRGQKIFMNAGCATCHPPALFTDLTAYDVGTGTGREANAELDTPTLVEVWRTGPYLHDGRATTIQEVFRRCNPDDRHGKTSKLNDRELDDLAAFVLSQ